MIYTIYTLSLMECGLNPRIVKVSEGVYYDTLNDLALMYEESVDGYCELEMRKEWIRLVIEESLVLKVGGIVQWQSGMLEIGRDRTASGDRLRCAEMEVSRIHAYLHSTPQYTFTATSSESVTRYSLDDAKLLNIKCGTIVQTAVCRLHDQASTHGTFLNDRRLTDLKAIINSEY
jgi:FHA domain